MYVVTGVTTSYDRNKWIFKYVAVLSVTVLNVTVAHVTALNVTVLHHSCNNSTLLV